MEAVRLVQEEGKTVGQVARDLDPTETALRSWVKRGKADRGEGKLGILALGTVTLTANSIVEEVTNCLHQES